MRRGLSEVSQDMAVEVEKNLLKYAVGRAISCPDCGRILDFRRAVYTDDGGDPPKVCGISCGACFDKTLERVRAKFGAVADKYLAGLDIVDGRKLRLGKSQLVKGAS